MQIKNIGTMVRTVSHRGKDYILTPEAWAEVPMTKDDADAFRAICFDVTGEPEKMAVPARKEKAE